MASSQVHVQALPAHLAPRVLPITVRQASADVCGVRTQVVCQDFADSTLVIVSQVGKVGCLTQVTMQRRPSHFASAAGAFDLDKFDDDDDDDDDGRKAPPPAAAQQTTSARPSAPLGFDGSSLLGSCQQQRLFGTHPAGQRALYDLYNINIAARAQHALQAADDADPALQSDKPVVVGLALTQRRRDAKADGDVDDDDDDDDFDVLAADERERFQQLLDLVGKACRS